jgi:hypothetical protein
MTRPTLSALQPRPFPSQALLDKTLFLTQASTAKVSLAIDAGYIMVLELFFVWELIASIIVLEFPS